jgi:hypothetical protein
VVVAAGKIERDDYRDGWQLVVDKIEEKKYPGPKCLWF